MVLTNATLSVSRVFKEHQILPWKVKLNYVYYVFLNFSSFRLFLGEKLFKGQIFFSDFIIHKICVQSSKYGSALKCSNKMCNYLLLAFFLFNFECRIRVELKILNWWQSQLYVILNNGCNTKQSKM